ncbi:RICIN domain-containing protein [Pilimelia columellifera]|uniref:Ricin B lectin domain-containing protein n=1 Tax=Pilimelia columellifera subsp. columellifera TaxID=706583 RepID=A0ABP6ANM9_9ACTN
MITGLAVAPGVAAASPLGTAGAQLDASTEAKKKAAAVIGWTVDGEAGLPDREFLTILWEKAHESYNAAVKAKAREALDDKIDPAGAAARFIESGIHAANEADVERRTRRVELDRQRLGAAMAVGWIPANDGDRQTMLSASLAGFVRSLGQRAEAGSFARAAAEAAQEDGATDKDLLALIATGFGEAAAKDREKKIADGKADEVQKQEAERLRDGKRSAIVVALQRAATPYEVNDLAVRELIYKIKTEATGRSVKVAANNAYLGDGPAEWETFVFVGVHLARAADLDERDRADAAATERQIRELLTNAVRDRYQPAMARAAKEALGSSIKERELFLIDGVEDAAAQDRVQPGGGKTVLLQLAGAGRCVQVIGAVDKPDVGGNAAGARMELGDCADPETRQRWTLVAVAGSKFKLRAASNSKMCAEVPQASIDTRNAEIAQAVCGDAPAQQWKFTPRADGTYELVNVASGKVITPRGGKSDRGTRIVQDNSSQARYQQWRLIDPTHVIGAMSPPEGVVRVKAQQARRCLQPVGPIDKPNAGGLAVGAPMEIRDCGSGKSQTWEAESIQGNQFALVNRASSLCLNVSGSRIDDGIVPIQARCNTAPAQMWVLMATTDGFRLRSALHGKYLEAKEGWTANGTPVQQWGFSTEMRQWWQAVPVTD